MKTLMTAAALAALIAAAPAFAEDALKPVAPAQTQTDTAAPAPAVAAPAATVAQADQQQMFIGQQAQDTVLASNWIGKTIYDSAGDNLGGVNDLIIDHDGKITAVVIGVGGFLGIGEKAVAVSFSSVQAGTDENGNVKLTIDATKDQLDAAPDFVTLAALKDKEAAPAPLGAAPGAPNPIPAPAPAPAPSN